MALFSKQATTARDVQKGDMQVHWVQSSMGFRSLPLPAMSPFGGIFLHLPQASPWQFFVNQ
jgi:hypothetical protein